jgi:hypothetical protein
MNDETDVMLNLLRERVCPILVDTIKNDIDSGRISISSFANNKFVKFLISRSPISNAKCSGCVYRLAANYKNN